jgi:ribosomal protein S18 acetylase RimI-like enzyme
MRSDPVVRVQRAGTTDATAVEAFAGAFDHAIRTDETARFLRDDRHHLLLGYLDDRPAGFVSAVEIFHPDKSPELFLNEIGVVEGSRRHGVAHALIEELARVARERGCVQIWVLTDEDNEAAMRLYGGTGGRWEGRRQVMFEYDLTEEPGS